jgi:hypothetical protein
MSDEDERAMALLRWLLALSLVPQGETAANRRRRRKLLVWVKSQLAG